MLCKIADLIIEVPDTEELAARCMAYCCFTSCEADIVIDQSRFRKNLWKMLSTSQKEYMESGAQFYVKLLRFSGIMLHASAVELNNRAYLFSGPCGMGKSTHTRLWQQTFGSAARVFNDDKPALRRMEDRWYAYGTPWCGKDGININMKVPLAGICFLKRGTENRIRRLSDKEAIAALLSQTLRRFRHTENLDLLLGHIDKLVREIPIFELENRPEPEAAMLSYETMLRAAEEAGL